MREYNKKNNSNNQQIDTQVKKTIYKINSTKVVEAKSILIIIIINLKKA